MRRPLTVIVLIAIGLIAGVFVLTAMTEIRGVGSFDQIVIVDSVKPILSVKYASRTVDEETRQLAERTANPQLFDWYDAKPLADGRFSAGIKFTTRGIALQERVYYPKHLVVLVDFADGSRACRVVDVPERRGSEPVLVRINS